LRKGSAQIERKVTVAVVGEAMLEAAYAFTHGSRVPAN
jgi:hypothetical protein